MSLSTQVLREIDKWDKVGREGVKKRLTTGLTDESGAVIAGVGLHIVQAEAIVALLDQRFGEGVNGMARWFNLIGTRFALMTALEGISPSDGRTMWDDLIDMPVNDDETWSEGRRPKNIGWALDDIAEAVRALAAKIEAT